ncbi:tyrosine-type recombinase/integrase [Agromyces ramosus]|uniref:tyrosine-type recombinase/integrase n=1 Tax=Agromyces ramosus TaxID=33879 RepID=UPI003594183A
MDFHSLRRSYATHLLTAYRYDIKFIQMQLGHEHAATTSIYTLPAADFQIAELARVHRETLESTSNAVAIPKRKLKLPPRPPLPPNRKKKRGAS